MPIFEVQYFSVNNSQWMEDCHSRYYESVSAVLEALRDQGYGAYRYREAGVTEPPGGERWAFAPSHYYPCRWQWGDAASNGEQYKDSYGTFSVPNPSNNPEWPIFDLLTRTVYHTANEYLSNPNQESAMPSPTTLPSSTTPVPNSSSEALVDIRVTRDEGKLVLTVNAANLHALLDSVGCRSSGVEYADQPDGSSFIANGRLTTRLLLRKEYPVKVLLSQFYSTPPTWASIKELCESGHTAVQKVLTHYQPVDIKYTINKMVK